MKPTTALLSALLAVSCIQASANAQGVMDEVYGRGVHAYFAGQDDKAMEWLNAAIDAGSQDPRVYYYRGLSTVRQAGGTFEAGLADFEEAANLEISAGRVVNVGRALERIQGELRRQIEDVRLKVRLANKDRLPRVPVAPAPATPLDATVDPFGDDSGMIGGQPEEMAAPAEVPAEPIAPAADAPAESPFGADAPAADAPAEAADPFGASEAANPFGDDAGAASDDPFGS